MFIGVISYLPDDEDKRAIRKEMIEKSVASLLNIFDPSLIKVCAQNYSRKDYIKKLDYVIKSKEGFGCGGARNELLKLFYESDEDFCMLLDDDTILYDTPCLRYLVHLMDSNSILLSQVDAICGKDIENEKLYTLFANKLSFAQMPFEHLNGLVILRNFKKYYDEEFYYENAVCEDELFRFTCLANKKSYICKELLYDGKMGGEVSTLGDFDNAASQEMYYADGCRAIWDRFGVQKTDNFSYDFASYPQVIVEAFKLRVKHPQPPVCKINKYIQK